MIESPDQQQRRSSFRVRAERWLADGGPRRQMQVHGCAALLVLGVHFAVAVAAADRGSLTYDENIHLPAGMSYLLERDCRLNPEHPPLAKLLAGAAALMGEIRWDTGTVSWRNAGVPVQMWREGRYLSDIEKLMHYGEYEWVFGSEILYELNGTKLEEILHRVHLVMTGMSVLLGFILWVGAYRRAGVRAGYVTVLLYGFCPVFLAHAPLATTDVTFALFHTLYVLSVIKFAGAGGEMTARSGLLAASGMVVGGAGAVLTKYSAPILLPETGVILLVSWLCPGCDERRVRLRPAIAGVAAVWIVVFVIVEILYQALFRAWFHDVWVMGFGITRFNTTIRPAAYLMGEWKDRHPAFFAVSLLFKPTGAAVILALGALVPLAVIAASGGSGETRRWALSVVAVIVMQYAAVASYFSQLGVRYLCPAIALIYLMAGIGYGTMHINVIGRILLGVLLAAHAAAAFLAFPHYIPYANIGTAARGRLYYFNDSNLNWGQSLTALGAYMREEGMSGTKSRITGRTDPAHYGVNVTPLADSDLLSSPPGTRIILDANEMQSNNVTFHYNLRKWILVTVIGHSYYVYEKPVEG